MTQYRDLIFVESHRRHCSISPSAAMPQRCHYRHAAAAAAASDTAVVGGGVAQLPFLVHLVHHCGVVESSYLQTYLRAQWTLAPISPRWSLPSPIASADGRDKCSPFH